MFSKIYRLFSALILASLLLLTLFGCEFSENSDVSKSTVSSSSSQTSAVNTNAEQSLAPNVAKVGEALSNSKWKMSLLSVKQYTEVGDNEYLKSKAKDGKVFLVLFFEVENLSKEDDYFNRLYAIGYVDDYAVEQATIFSDVEGNSTLTGTVAAEKKLKGYLAWEVSKDWKDFELNFDESFFGDTNQKFVFSVKPTDIAK